ncbi:MAG: nucleotidyltransferase domain-containing protein [Candidatus Ranarchaeia archaeon]
MSVLESIDKLKAERKQVLRNCLETLKAQLEAIGAIKIIVFGSFNEDAIDLYSDLDLLVVMPPTKSGKKWLKTIYNSLNWDCAIDILVYNTRELEEAYRANRFIQQIINQGSIVYEKTG